MFVVRKQLMQHIAFQSFTLNEKEPLHGNYLSDVLTIMKIQKFRFNTLIRASIDMVSFMKAMLY